MRVSVSELAGLLSGSAAVCPLLMINLLAPPSQAPQAFGFPLHWGRNPGCQLPGALVLRNVGSRDGREDTTGCKVWDGIGP